MDPKEIRIIALQNAIKYEGKASPGSVIGALLAADPTLKTKIKELGKEIAQIVIEVNGMDLDAQIEELKSIDPALLEEKKKGRREGLKPLKNAEEGKVVMRFAPSPSGPMHIGHSIGMSLNYLYAKQYQGKLILRIDDTNPDNIYVPAYEMLPEEANWLTENYVSEVALESSMLDTYYDAMEQLMEAEKVYICDCDPETFKELLKNHQPCPCRGLGKAEVISRWKKMFEGYNQGEAVVRIKSDINHKNPAMRDFPLFRINESEHPKTGTQYRVWPLMNMAVAVDDMKMGVTHALRAKDHADNARRQALLHEYLGVSTPETVFLGKINFEGMPLSASKTKEAIENGEYVGWGDIRLGFLEALKKRGYQPKAFVDYAESVGVSLADKSVAKEEFFKQLNHFNKQIIDPVSDRYFFVWDPVALSVKDAPSQTVELDLHPEHKKGGRSFETATDFLICKEDLDTFESGKMYRLMDCVNFIFGENTFHSRDYMKFKKSGAKIIHWLPHSDDLVDVEVLMPDTSTVSGKGEAKLTELTVGSVVQLERFGFCRLEKIEGNTLTFWFAHK